jgi:biopolymer transport protein ExbB
MPEIIRQALEYLRLGGWIMIPLLLCSVLMWMLILERWRTYRHLMSGDIRIDHAIEAVTGGPAPEETQGLRAGLVHRFIQERCGDPAIDRKILGQCALSIRNHLKDKLAVIAVLASVAPLLGLLGTVLGMIETFQVISQFGTGNARAMAGGISVALVTTQSGLVIAIPGLFISGTLQRRARNLEDRLEEISTILDRHIRNRKVDAG